MRLTNKLAIITGGSRGIGYATAEKFLQEGATVILTASSQASADKAAQEGIAVLSSDKTSFEISGILYAAGLTARPA